MSTKIKTNNILGDTIVELALIGRNANAVMENGDDVALMKGCTLSIIPDVDSSNVLKRVLSDEEAEFLEEKLALGKGGLNIHNKGDANFWNTSNNARLEFTRKNKALESATIKLDLSNEYDFIKYKIALNHRLVCPEWSKRYDNPDWKISIRTLEAEEREQTNKVDIEVAVLEYIMTNKTSKVKLFNLLRLFNQKSARTFKKLEHTQNARWMFNQLWECKNDKKDVKILHDIISMDETIRDNKIFLINAITCGAITTRGPIHMVNGGGLLGNSEQEVIDFLADKKNSNVKMKLQSLVDDYLKTLVEKD